MKIKNNNIRNISSKKIKQENESQINLISNKDSNKIAKSQIKDKRQYKSQIKEKSPLQKFTTKNLFEMENKNELLYANKEMKKNLTQKLFDPNTKINNSNIKKVQNIKSSKMIEIENKNNNNLKIKVKKVFDLNELTVLNLTNEKTTSSNKNKEIKAFENLDSENFEFFKINNSNNFQGRTAINKLKFEDKEIKEEKELENRKSQKLKEFPIFNNSFLINENDRMDNLSRNFRNMLDIETLPNIKYFEVNSLNESYNDNISNSSLVKKSRNKLVKKDEKSLAEKNSNEINNDYCKEPCNNYLSLDENLNFNNNTIFNNNNFEKNNKSGANIKETFTLFLQNNSKKDFIEENSKYNNYKEENKESTRKVFINNTNNNNFTNNNVYNFTKDEVNHKASGKILGVENNIVKNLSKNFYSPQKNRLKFSKTKNFLSSFSKHNISELSQTVANCDNILSFIELNKKLKSDVEILIEKIKTLKKIQQNKNYEIELLKSKYTEAIENYKNEIEKSKELKEKIKKQNLITKNLQKKFKILANNLIEITELLLLSKTSNDKRASLFAPENASLSIDIYDSYNNEDENGAKRAILQEQIQALLVSKFNYFKKNLNLNLDSEIEKIKNWNSHPNFLNGRINSNSNNTEMNISNIKITAKNNDNDSFESSKKNISQDYFDMSISNQFLNLNQIPSGNFSNLSNNINININQKPQFIFTNNNFNKKQNPNNNSFGMVDGESDNIFGSNSNNNYNSNANNNINFNNNFNLNTSFNKDNKIANYNLINYSSNKEKRSNNEFTNNKNKWTLVCKKEEQLDINSCNWNKSNYNSNNREEKFRIDSINNLIGANGINIKNLALSSNYNSNSNNIFDSFLQSAKGPSKIYYFIKIFL